MGISRKIIEQHPDIEAILPELLRAAFDGNKRRLELLAIAAIRKLRQSSPQTAEALANILSAGHAADFMRSAELEPSPVDSDSSAPLLRVEAPGESPRPVFAANFQNDVDRFLRERIQSERLLSEGFLPPRSILVKGPPGTGKTMFAKWLSCELRLKLVTLDLATSISSYLGKTGLNLRRALDYARATPCLLLLDEFDAVAKKRDDPTELGELKRIVNVLLKELEEWPPHSLLVAATNHPELLDPAIARRFDRVFMTENPFGDERLTILEQSLSRFSSEIEPAMLRTICDMLAGCSASDVNSVGTAAARRHIVEGQSIALGLTAELTCLLANRQSSAKALGKVIRMLRKNSGGALTVRDISALTGLVPSAVHYHLKKGSEDARKRSTAHTR